VPLAAVVALVVVVVSADESGSTDGCVGAEDGTMDGPVLGWKVAPGAVGAGVGAAVGLVGAGVGATDGCAEGGSVEGVGVGAVDGCAVRGEGDAGVGAAETSAVCCTVGLDVGTPDGTPVAIEGHDDSLTHVFDPSAKRNWLAGQKQPILQMRLHGTVEGFPQVKGQLEPHSDNSRSPAHCGLAVEPGTELDAAVVTPGLPLVPGIVEIG